MGGIFGIVGGAEPAELRAMGRRLAHRAPDAEVWSLSGDVHLGQGASPDDRSSPCGRPVAFEGILENLGELADDLKVGPEHAGSAPSVVLALYRRLGAGGFDRLRGQFAIAIWDEAKQRLVLVRDHLGIRSLYFGWTGTRLLFASEYKALLVAEDLPARPDRQALQHVHRTKRGLPGSSCLQGVRPVPPGSWIELGKGGGCLLVARYWAPALHETSFDESVSGQARVLRERILDALRRQSAGHESVGLELSGGLDASIVLAGLRKVAPDKTVHSFTAGFGPSDGEILRARAVSRHFGTEHHELFMEPEEVPGLLPPTIWHMEEPLGREETAFLYLLSRSAAGYVDLLFTGRKADALFGGMPRHRVIRLAGMAPVGRRSLEQFFHFTQSGAEPRTLGAKALVRWYYRGDEFPAPRIAGGDGSGGPDPLPLSSAQPLSEKLRRDLLEDVGEESCTQKIHGALGLSYTTPFADPAVIDCALGMPDRLKIRGVRQKYILRKAFEGLMPPFVLRRKKSLQKLRHDERLSEVLDGLADELLSPAVLASRGLFEADYVDRLRRRAPGTAYPTLRLYRLWSLLLTEIWCRLFIDGRGAPPGQTEFGLPGP